MPAFLASILMFEPIPHAPSFCNGLGRIMILSFVSGLPFGYQAWQWVIPVIPTNLNGRFHKLGYP